MSLESFAFEAGKKGMLLSQLLAGIKEKDREAAVKHFTRGVLAAKKEEHEAQRTTRSQNS